MKYLTKQDLIKWENQSYLVFKGLLSHQVDLLNQWVDEVFSWPYNQEKWLTFYEMDHPQLVSRIENFVPYHTGLADLLLKSQIVEIISELMGEPAILYKERINFKMPNGGAHAAHQDGVAYESGNKIKFDSNTNPFISILICVDRATKENGCLQIADHWPLDKLDILPMEQPIKDRPAYSKIAQHVEDQLEWRMIETEPGDVIFFTERLLHRSTANFSDNSRRIIYGVYNPLSEGDKREKYYDDKRQNINDARYLVGNPHAPVKIDLK